MITATTPEQDVEAFEKWSAESTTNLATMLEDVRSFVCRYMTFAKEAQATAVSLWIAHTWVIDAFDYSPYLHIGSPVKQCGKSRLLDCLKVLSQKSWHVITPSAATLFRKIEADVPTLLLDEVDAIFKGKADAEKESLRGLLNAGFERKATVPRCEAAGRAQKVVEYRVFCPKALAGIGKLPDTVADRSIPIILARRARKAGAARFRLRDIMPIAQPIADALSAWAQSPGVIETLRMARPGLPDELNDRAQDICEPLLAIADMAGGDWPDEARWALVELCTGTDAEDDHVGVKLLTAIREIFDAKGVKQLSVKDMIKALIERETDEPWAVWWEESMLKGNVRGLGSKLAKLLKPFGIVSGTIREADDNTAKGYKRHSFEAAFNVYCPKTT